jgi:hypothetical protein
MNKDSRKIYVFNVYGIDIDFGPQGDIKGNKKKTIISC